MTTTKDEPYFGRSLEQSCVESGHWLIEGYDVMGIPRRPGRYIAWEVFHCGVFVDSVTYLNDARRMIAERLEQS
jgi:hypothetical protein